jgi:hypothetical protein
VAEAEHSRHAALANLDLFLGEMVEHEFEHLLSLVLVDFWLLALSRRFVSANNDDEVSFRVVDWKLDSVAFRRRGGHLVATGAFENWLPFFALARAHQTAALRTKLHISLHPRKCVAYWRREYSAIKPFEYLPSRLGPPQRILSGSNQLSTG